MWLEIAFASQNMYLASAFSQTFAAGFFRLLLSELYVYGFLGPFTDKLLGTNLQSTPSDSTYSLPICAPLLCRSLLLEIKKTTLICTAQSQWLLGEDEAPVFVIKCAPLISRIRPVASQNWPLVSPKTITTKHGLMPTT